jgi:ParB-like chromosome segregation protein Spo0J
MAQEISINKIFPNEVNPRFIKDKKFKQLMKSIKEFPQMLTIRPIVVDEDFVILGGNMRYLACKELGLKQVPILVASDLTEDQKKEFIIKDNAGFGDWDWDLLANMYDDLPLDEWGLDIPKFESVNDQMEEAAPKESLKLEINCKSEEELDDIYIKCLDLGFNVSRKNGKC